MAAIDTSSPSHKAALTRVVVTALLILPIGFVGLLYGGTGVGLPCAIPALYMLWALGADVVALARGAEVYRARPAYKWFVGAGVLVVALWVGFMLAQGGQIFG